MEKQKKKAQAKGRMLTFSFLIISLFFPNISKLIVDAAEKECSANPADSNFDRGEKRPHASTQGKSFSMLNDLLKTYIFTSLNS